MSKRKPIILPDEPLPMAIPESGRWPLARSRAARDASAQWLCERAKSLSKLLRGAYRRRIEQIQTTGSQKAAAYVTGILRSRQDFRAYAELQRLVTLSRWVRLLESPPANPRPRSLKTLANHAR
jgi:hypothetical protein